jgi:hypothetical protein
VLILAHVIREDYLLRMIQQLADAVARMAARRTSGQLEQALREGEAAYDLLGVPRELCDVLDSPALADRLRDPDKIRAMARLAWEEGRIWGAKGDPRAGLARMRRALELFLEARARAPADGDEADAAAILELSRIVPAEHLAPRYRSA